MPPQYAHLAHLILRANSYATDSLDKDGEEEFEQEKAYLESHLGEDLRDSSGIALMRQCGPETSRIAKDAAEAKRLAHDDALANGAGIECGCCFGEEIWVSTRLSDISLIVFSMIILLFL